jgi:hypothetical protein
MLFLKLSMLSKLAILTLFLILSQCYSMLPMMSLSLNVVNVFKLIRNRYVVFEVANDVNVNKCCQCYSMLINVSKVHNVFEIQTGLERGQEAVVLVEPAGMRNEGRSVEPAGRERSGQRRKRIMIRRRRSVSGSGFVKVLGRRRVLVVEDDGGRAAADGESVTGK